MSSQENDPRRRKTILDAFEAILDLPPDERALWLGQTFGDDHEAIEAVLALFAADEVAPAAMPTMPPQDGGEGSEAIRAPGQIGPFALRELVGAGGMGDVWRGERTDGLFEQRVAIKLLRPPRFHPDAFTFFESERRLLARLNHPNIARLFDGGVTPEGVPWFIMEFIEGRPLNQYVDAKAPDLAQRIALMIVICEAVHAAHQALVVHADLKPSNILITDDGKAYLVDFGIATLIFTHENEAERRGFPSTPAYSSPERRAGAPPTTADDVYALGLILTGVLSGFWPISPVDPRPAPSSLVPSTRARALRGDLDAIATKAAAARREDRYASVAAMADDLKAWTERRPVTARGAEPGYRVRRFVERHPAAIGSGVAAAVAGLLALVVMTGLYQRAEHERAIAQARFNDVRQLAGFMLGELYDALDRLPGGARLKARTTNLGQTYLDRLSVSGAAPADLDAEVAVGLGRLGHARAVSSTNSSGETTAGAADLARSEERLRRLLASAPQRSDLKIELARTLAWRSGVLLGARNDIKAAHAKLDEAFGLLDKVLALTPEATNAAYVRMNAVLGRADVLVAENRLQDLIRLITPEEKALLKLPRSGAYAAEQALMHAAMENALGDAAYYVVSPQTGLAHYQSAVAVLTAAREAGLRDVRIPIRLALYDNQVASSFQDMRRPKEGLGWANAGRALAQEVARYDDSVLSERALSTLDLESATLLSDLGDHAGAVRIGGQSVERRRRALAADPENQELKVSLASGLRSFAEHQAAAGRRAEACRSALEALDLFADVARRGGVPKRYEELDMKSLRSLRTRCVV